jgi:hypothetical protein
MEIFMINCVRGRKMDTFRGHASLPLRKSIVNRQLKNNLNRIDLSLSVDIFSKLFL